MRRLSARYGHHGPSFWPCSNSRVIGQSIRTCDTGGRSVHSSFAGPIVHDLATETVPSVAGSGVFSDDGLSDVDDMEHPSLGVTSGLEEISASAATRAAMATLDAVDLSEVFTVRARVLKCPIAILERCIQILLEDCFG